MIGKLFKALEKTRSSLLSAFKNIKPGNISSEDLEKIEIRMNELICDGVLVSTAAGSTAYNLSAHGSILPLESKLLALTPISAFRPRRWRGALLSEKNIIKIDVLNYKERLTSVTADNIEFRNIKTVTINSSNEKNCKILFDKNHSIEDKILNEQFEY